MLLPSLFPAADSTSRLDTAVEANTSTASPGGLALSLVHGG